MDLSLKHDSDIFASLTDAGVCHVYNGNPVAATFKTVGKTGSLKRAIDPRSASEFEPKQITGTGKNAERTFWLNIADK